MEKIKLNTTGTVSRIRTLLSENKGGKFISVSFQSWNGKLIKTTTRMLPNRGNKIIRPDIIRMYEVSTQKNIDIPIERVRSVKVNGEIMEF